MKFKIHLLFLIALISVDTSAFTKRARTPRSTSTGLHHHGTTNEPCYETHGAPRRTAAAANDIQQAVAAQGHPSGFSLVNKAMSQISCPTRNIGVGAGRCSENGYRASSYDCAYYVRKALAGTVLPAGIGGLGHAKDVGCNLQRHGLKNLCGMRCASGRATPTCNLNPYSVPVGAVLIYDNVGSNCHWAGHIEIRTDRGFVSDYFSTRPRNVNSCRRLIGVWTK